MKANKNQEVANRIDTFKLSEEAIEVIESTPLNSFNELFGNCYSAQDAEDVVKDLLA